MRLRTRALAGGMPAGYGTSPAFCGWRKVGAGAVVAIVTVVALLTGIAHRSGIDTLSDSARPSDIERLVRTSSGVWPLAVDPSTGDVLLLTDPQLTWVVTRQAQDRYAFEPIAQGLTAFNGVSGSLIDFSVEGGHPSAAGAMRDGLNLVFVDDDCSKPDEPIYGAIHRHVGTGTRTLEVDIGLCPALRADDPRLVTAVVRHETGHALGLAHLHERGVPRWVAESGDVSICRFMYHGVHLCQAFGPSEQELAAQLYPNPEQPAPAARQPWQHAIERPTVHRAPSSSSTCPVIAEIPRGVQRGSGTAACRELPEAAEADEA